MRRHAHTPVIERQRADVAGFGQYPPGMVEHLRAGGGQGLQATATPLEDQEPQLVLEPLDLLGKSRLRGVHASGGVGDVEAGISDGNEIAKLGESHLGRPGCGGGKRHDTRCSRVSSWACASAWDDPATSRWLRSGDWVARLAAARLAVHLAVMTFGHERARNARSACRIRRGWGVCHAGGERE